MEYFVRLNVIIYDGRMIDAVLRHFIDYAGLNFGLNGAHVD